jgi:hypothetical protein
MSYSSFYARLHAGGQKTGAALGAVIRFYPSRFYFAAIIFWQILAWLQAGYIFRNLTGDLLVLHYNVDFGVDLVGDPSRIFLYPLFGLIAWFAALILTALCYRQSSFKAIAHLLLGGAAVFGFFLSLALLSVYLINFF